MDINHTLEQQLEAALNEKTMTQALLAHKESIEIDIRRQIAFRDYGVRPGVIVLSKKGVRMRVVFVTPLPQNNCGMRNEKPWVTAVPETHKNSIQPKNRLMFDDWVLA